MHALSSELAAGETQAGGAPSLRAKGRLREPSSGETEGPKGVCASPCALSLWQDQGIPSPTTEMFLGTKTNSVLSMFFRVCLSIWRLFSLLPTKWLPSEARLPSARPAAQRPARRTSGQESLASFGRRCVRLSDGRTRPCPTKHD